MCLLDVEPTAAKGFEEHETGLNGTVWKISSAQGNTLCNMTEQYDVLKHTAAWKHKEHLRAENITWYILNRNIMAHIVSKVKMNFWQIFWFYWSHLYCGKYRTRNSDLKVSQWVFACKNSAICNFFIRYHLSSSFVNLHLSKDIE